jgi:hypothetical protein
MKGSRFSEEQIIGVLREHEAGGEDRAGVPAPRDLERALLAPGRGGAHLACIYIRIAARADEFRLDRGAAGSMDQFHWRSCASSHPTVAPRGHGGDERIEIKPLFREQILESRRTIFLGDAAQDSIAHQFAQAVRQAMRRQLQVLPVRIEPAEAEERFAYDQHRPAVADHRQGSCDQSGHGIDLPPAHLRRVFANPLTQTRFQIRS